MKEKSKHEELIEKKFEFFDVTADIGFWAYGGTLNEAYENAALAMFNVMTNTDKVSHKISKRIKIESEDLVSLLYDFLEELLVLHELDSMFFSEFNISINKIDNEDNLKYLLKGIVIGDKINWNTHDKGSEVKAITFHKMEVISNKISKVRVILDL